MTEAGLTRVDFPLPDLETVRLPPTAQEIPEWLESALKANPFAWENFKNLPPSHQRRYIAWISDARREATREKRIHEAIAMLEEKKRLGIGRDEVRK
jgi:uncharacterized protein YdeI (YjbR/CyaY-like superfamily)